jgi:hypothetical protein
LTVYTRTCHTQVHSRAGSLVLGVSSFYTGGGWVIEWVWWPAVRCCGLPLTVHGRGHCRTSWLAKLCTRASCLTHAADQQRVVGACVWSARCSTGTAARVTVLWPAAGPQPGANCAMQHSMGAQLVVLPPAVDRHTCIRHTRHLLRSVAFIMLCTQACGRVSATAPASQHSSSQVLVLTAAARLWRPASRRMRRHGAAAAGARQHQQRRC